MSIPTYNGLKMPEPSIRFTENSVVTSYLRTFMLISECHARGKYYFELTEYLADLPMLANLRSYADHCCMRSLYQLQRQL